VYIHTYTYIYICILFFLGKILEDQPDLKDLHTLLQDRKYSKLKFIKNKSYSIQCNWKVFIDNYLDGGYHVPIAHPDLASNLDMNTYKKEIYLNYFMQSCQSKSDLNENEESAILDGKSQINADIDNVKLKSLESNRYNDDNKAALYVYHYPNLMINRYGSW
jgi:choline monooxygenase